MPTKLNKAGKQQEYIPKGNGDASGEYGTSNGTNKNFTTSDKKKTEANVITENKSVVVDKKELKFVPFKEWIKKPGAKEKLEKGIPQFLQKRAEREKKEKGYSELEKLDWGIKENNKQIATLEKSGKYPDMLKRLKEQNAIMEKQKEEIKNGKREKADLADDGIERKEGKLPWEENKANVIDGDLTGKKEETLVDEKTQKEINDRISGWDNKMRYMMLSRMQSDVKYYLGAGGRSKRDLWAQDEKEHIAYMETLYNGLKEKPEWLSKKELENYKKELLKK